MLFKIIFEDSQAKERSGRIGKLRYEILYIMMLSFEYLILFKIFNAATGRR
jgi:hypothetical protein